MAAFSLALRLLIQPAGVADIAIGLQQPGIINQHGVEAGRCAAGIPFKEHADSGRMIGPQVPVGTIVLFRILVFDEGFVGLNVSACADFISKRFIDQR